MSRTTLPVRRLNRRFGALAVLLGLVLAVLLPAAAAEAAAYRYWGYYQLSGTTWQFATKGPAETNPADGSVEGWRFSVSGETDARMPRVSVTFDQVCGDTAAGTGNKRVAVVVDYGRQADSEDSTEPPAPVAHCAVVAEAATGLEVLGKVTEVRRQKGLICGIDGYPATGCGGAVKTVSAAAAAPDTPVTLKPEKSSTAKATAKVATDDSGSHTGTYLGIGVVLLAGAAVGYAVARRRRGA